MGSSIRALLRRGRNARRSSATYWIYRKVGSMRGLSRRARGSWYSRTVSHRDANSLGTANGSLSEQSPSCRSGSGFAGSNADDPTAGDATGFSGRLAVEGRDTTEHSSNDCQRRALATGRSNRSCYSRAREWSNHSRNRRPLCELADGNGRSPQSARNVKSHVNRARRL